MPCRHGGRRAGVPTTLGFLRGAGNGPLRLLERVALAEPAIQEAGQILQAFLQHVLGRPLRSAQFLGRL
jgi:hypothetical protein